MPLGRFLEISLAANDVAESLAFYEALGFVQAVVGEAWPHPYAVVTDGRISLGLHGLDFESPLPTWVAPWKSSTAVVDGKPDTASENESLDTLANP